MYCDQRNLYSIIWAMSGILVDLCSIIIRLRNPAAGVGHLINQVCCAEEYFRTFLDLMTALVSEMKTDADYKAGRMA